jgi:hypothetical protein
MSQLQLVDNLQGQGKGQVIADADAVLYRLPSSQQRSRVPAPLTSRKTYLLMCCTQACRGKAGRGRVKTSMGCITA